MKTNLLAYLIQIFIKGIVVAIVIFFTAISLEYFFGRMVVFNRSLLIEVLHYLLYGVVLTAINSVYFDYLNRKFAWSKHQKLQKFRLAVGFFGSVFFTIIGVFFIRVFLGMVVGQKTFQAFIASENVGHYVVTLIITMIVSLVFHVIYFYKSSQEKKVVEQKIIASSATAQLESLKNQIDPHFLFNSLNVLSSLIEENPDMAQRFTTSLSKVYRYVLDQKDKELVSLKEELDFAVTYMKLLQMRFENSIEFHLPEIPEDYPGKVVPLSLQLLLENCIKHNLASEQKPLKIEIIIANDQLLVRNNLQKKESLSNRKGVGISNIVQRYDLLTQRKVVVETTNQHFNIYLPILTKQLQPMETNQPTNQELYLKAKKRVEDLKGFYGNLFSYCLVIPLLIFINYQTYWEFKWFFFPMLGWGLGLAMHALQTFGYAQTWEEKKIKELMEKEKQQKWG
ncbi:MAG: histidine kinase [Flavobacteriales bacterium]|nr:histidine kinase [Flavobacteriales bacterium]